MARLPRPAEREMARVMLEEYPDESARLLERATPEDAASVLSTVRFDVCITVLRRLTTDRVAGILPLLSGELSAKVLRALSPNRAAAVLARLDDEARDRSLGALEDGLATELRSLQTYPEDSAGGLMDPRVTSFGTSSTARDVIRRLRGLRNRRVSDVFVTDEDGCLVGAIPLQEVVLAAPDARLDTLVTDVPVRVSATDSREAAVEAFEEQRVSSLPVVDFEGHLVGVLRQRELIQAARERATSSVIRMVGASEEERALSSSFFVVRKRLPWLEVNLLTAFLAAGVVGLFEETIAAVTALAVLLPVVAGQSGNTGAQALAVTMRGLAMREIRTRHWIRVILKELSAGALNGTAVAVPTALAVYLWSDSTGLAAVIALAMLVSMTLAGASGAAVPMILTALRQDPAQSSSIVLTTVTDVVGFATFLGIATALRGYL